MRRNIQALFMGITTLCMVTGCSKDDKGTVSEGMVMNDVAYGTDARQKMDVYLPANRSSNTAVIVLLHGGGFVAGDKSDISERAVPLSAKGYAVLNVNHRLVDTSGIFQTPLVHKPSSVRIAEQLQDIKAAVELAAGKAAEWKVSTTRWAIAGHSAGATLAMLYAYTDVNTGGLVKVAANWAGATDFSFQDESQFDLLDPRLVEVYYRAVGYEPVNANKLAYMAVSPYWIVSSGKGAATINIRPENNEVFNIPDVSATLYEAFTNVLTSKNIPNKYLEVKGADHGFGQPGNWDQVINETDIFFRQELP